MQSSESHHLVKYHPVKPYQRWRLAVNAISISHYLLSLANKVVVNNTQLLTAVMRSPSYLTIDIQPVPEPEDRLPSLNVNQKTLSDMVREKNLEQLHQFGGAKAVAAILETDEKGGIKGNDADLMHRKDVFGSNKFQMPPAKGFLSFVLEACKDAIIIILLVCAILSLGFGIKRRGLKEGWYDGGSIVLAIFLVVAISAVSNFRQSRQFNKLSKESSDIRVEVVRDWRRQHGSIFDVVVGDIVCLKIGDQIPADGLFLDGHSLKVNESSMTGESDHVEIDDSKNPFLFSGTKVTDGYGRMLVTSVGMNSAWGEMMSLTSRDLNEQTPLQARLNKLTSLIGKVGLTVAFIVLGVLLFRYFTGNTKDDLGNREFNGSKTKVNDVMNAVVRIIAAAVTIVVVAIPEGLPLAVTLTLAYSMKQMMADHAMVRKLSACETMGSVTTILLGLVGLKDPCRPGVKTAVESCRHAGVNIKMITGDNLLTAKAIATECGILNPTDNLNSGAVVEGESFRNFSDQERMEKVDTIRVMARSSPFDKLLMVQCLKQKGHVVAVTGDGTNDAPALKEADIGLSMGIQGTEVAKESSDIVILDDNFNSVVTVLKWGRCVYNNIQKFIQFQLTVNVAALVINLVAAVYSGEVPLTAVQLLWVNLIMDTLGALALATEQPTDILMTKPPMGRFKPLITTVMWRNLVAQALYQVTVLLALQFKGESIFGVHEEVKDTLIFNCFVLCQVFNEFNARKLEERNIFKGITKNKLFLGIIGITIVLQVVMVEFLKKFADTERLNWGQWAARIGIAAVSWPIGWLVKCIPVSNKWFLNFSRHTAFTSRILQPEQVGLSFTVRVSSSLPIFN